MNPGIDAVIIVLIALSFDFVNGFHDAANSIATVVSTRVLSPRLAVAWAAAWNFIAFLAFGTAVAKTVGSGIIDLNKLPTRTDGFEVILAAVIGAIAFDLITWVFGIPTSSSHALAGGLAGAGLAFGGPSILVPSGITTIAIFIVISPIVGFLLAVIVENIVLGIAQFLTKMGWTNLTGANKGMRRGQLVSSAAMSLGHGANDAQKTMGIIAAVLFLDAHAGTPLSEQLTIPLWVVLAAYTSMALGTLAGGWRIVRTLGSKITKLQPVGGLAAETAAATTLFTTAHLGIPVSTTHTMTGAVIGVGTTNRFSAVRWGLTHKVLWAWILTIPGAGLIAAGTWALLQVVSPVITGGLVLISLLAWGMSAAYRRASQRAEVVLAPPT
jgi:inorganic phosphate transporter, PiT family